MSQHQKQFKKRPEQSDAPVKMKRPFKVGDPLEYRVVRLFMYLGSFARRGREIYTVGHLDTATDLDVLAIRYSDPLRREVQIVECKGGSGEGPMDRVFWLAGVKNYVGASRATLVRPATKWNVKDFAAELGVEILDLPHLEEMEKAIGVSPTTWPGVSDWEYFAREEAGWNKILNRDAATKELFLTLAGEIRFHEPFGGISFLLYQLRMLTRSFREHRYLSESLSKFLLAESVSQLAVFLLRIAETTMPLSPTDRDGFIRKGLTYGHMDKAFVDRLFSNAKRITSEMVRLYTGKHVKVEDSYFTMPEPPNVKEIQELVGMLVAHPTLANTFAPLLDMLLFERFLKQRDVVELLPKIFPFSNLKERISMVQDYLRILNSMDAAPDSLWAGSKRLPTTAEGNTKPAAAEKDEIANASKPQGEAVNSETSGKPANEKSIASNDQIPNNARPRDDGGAKAPASKQTLFEK